MYLWTALLTTHACVYRPSRFDSFAEINFVDAPRRTTRYPPASETSAPRLLQIYEKSSVKACSLAWIFFLFPLIIL